MTHILTTNYAKNYCNRTLTDTFNNWVDNKDLIVLRWKASRKARL